MFLRQDEQISIPCVDRLIYFPSRTKLKRSCHRLLSHFFSFLVRLSYKGRFFLFSGSICKTMESIKDQNLASLSLSALGAGDNWRYNESQITHNPSLRQNHLATKNHKSIKKTKHEGGVSVCFSFPLQSCQGKARR